MASGRQIRCIVCGERLKIITQKIDNGNLPKYYFNPPSITRIHTCSNCESILGWGGDT